MNRSPVHKKAKGVGEKQWCELQALDGWAAGGHRIVCILSRAHCEETHDYESRALKTRESSSVGGSHQQQSRVIIIKHLG